ncbi:hypothetical protein ACE6H2_019865 [Prunus campanulata]
MKRHVEVNLQNGIVAQCPHKRCKCEVNVETCKKFLSPKLADVMIQRIKECSIPATEKVYCAFPRCSALMSKKEVLEHTKSSFASMGGRKCMKCHQLFCINCKVPWHYDMNCYDYQRSETYSLAEEQLLKSLAMKKLWRQCSKCKHMVELASGCCHVTCRKAVVVGAGVAICDRRDNLIFESRKNLKSLNHFALRSRKTAELLALIDGLKEALTLKSKRVVCFCDDYLIYQYVTSTLPGSSEIAALDVTQATRSEKKFAYFVFSGGIKFASKLAIEATALFRAPPQQELAKP